MNFKSLNPKSPFASYPTMYICWNTENNRKPKQAWNMKNMFKQKPPFALASRVKRDEPMQWWFLRQHGAFLVAVLFSQSLNLLRRPRKQHREQKIIFRKAHPYILDHSARFSYSTQFRQLSAEQFDVINFLTHSYLFDVLKSNL